MKTLNLQDLVDRLDYDKLYEDLGWEPTFSSGDEDKGYCLMTQNHKNGDTTGKLAINRSKGVYNCWVCGGGSMLSLVMEVKGIDYSLATEYLYQFVDAYSKESPQDFYSRVAKMMERPKEEIKPLPHFNERVIESWTDKFHPWFVDRHIYEDVREEFRLGYDAVAKRMTKDGSYEGPAIILPHFWKERLVGWQSRWLDPDRPKWLGKYTNTTDFPRETTLWGYDRAKTQKQPPIIVESVPTALMLIGQGYSAVSTFGSQITREQLRLLRVFVYQGVILAPDNDLAGTNWMNTAMKELDRYVKILRVPLVEGEGADLGDLSPDEVSVHLKGVTYGF